MPEFEIRRGDPPPCGRCGGAVLLTVQVPYAMPLPGGGESEGRRTVALCPNCDAHDPAATGVLAFFTVHPEINADTLSDVVVIREWIDHHIHNPPVYTDETLDQEIADWRDEQTSDDDSGGSHPIA